MLNPLVTHFSDVELSGEDFAHSAKAWPGQRPLSIATVGSLAQPYKGVDVLIKAAASLVKAGTEVELTVVGDGRCRADLERLARSCELRVRFVGNIPRPEVLRTLDDCDLFALASRTEGLPRAMIEAMARGLPCVGTRVGGVPELLAPDDLVNPGSVPELASKIRELAGNLDRLHAAAKRNLRVAQEYREDRLRRRRRRFYSQIRGLTESWLATVPVPEPRTGS